MSQIIQLTSAGLFMGAVAFLSFYWSSVWRLARRNDPALARWLNLPDLDSSTSVEVFSRVLRTSLGRGLPGELKSKVIGLRISGVACLAGIIGIQAGTVIGLIGLG
jgi:hypothetical protein